MRVRCLGRITLCRRTRSLILIRLPRPRPSQCGALDDRLSAIHRAHGATRGCIAHMQRPCTRTIIYRDHLLLLLLPCPHAARRRIARPTPGLLLSIRSRCARGRISLSRSVIRDENFSDGPRSARDTFANYDRATRKKTWHFSYPDWWILSFSCNVLFEETKIFFSFFGDGYFILWNFCKLFRYIFVLSIVIFSILIYFKKLL